MRGETVIVRAYGNEPLLRKVWDADNEVVFICSDENFDALTAGRPALNPVGFHRQNVFHYDPKVFAALVKKPMDLSMWKRLRHGDEEGARQ